MGGKVCTQNGLKAQNALPIVFYGSSITQGGCASRAGNTYVCLLYLCLCLPLRTAYGQT